MGIALNSLLVLTRALPGLGDLSDKQVLALGLQDCHFTYDQLVNFLTVQGITHRPLDPDEVRLTTGFKWVVPGEAEAYLNYVHQETLFRVLGFDPGGVHALDLSDFEGADIVHDLNVPVDEGLVEKFDLIFDGGTIEHVFSLKDSLFNTARLCKVGGVVVHISPADSLGHGLINLSAGLYRDFYAANGFDEVSVGYMGLPMDARRVGQYFLEFTPEELDFSLRPRYSTAVFSIFRKAEAKELVVPQQGFYTRLWEKPSSNAKHPQWGGKLRSIVPDWTQRLAYSVAGAPVQSLGRLVKRRRAKRVSLLTPSRSSPPTPVASKNSNHP